MYFRGFIKPWLHLCQILQVFQFMKTMQKLGGESGLADLKTCSLVQTLRIKKRQRALLLHYAGEDVNEIFDTLTDTGEDIATAKLKLKEYFAPK